MSKRVRGAALACVLAGAAAGCAPGPVAQLEGVEEPAAQLASGRQALPRVGAVADVPVIAQRARYCGPASLAMALGAIRGEAPGQDALAEQVYTPDKAGALQADMLSAARRRGALAVELDGASLNQLLAYTAAGKPAIAFANRGLSWAPVWHYSVVAGYDLDAGTMTLHDGRDTPTEVTLGRFDRRWARGDRWALVLSQPDSPPFIAGETALVRAAAGLEQAGQPAAAAATYRAIRREWPESRGAAIGLANTLHTRHRYAEAAAILAERTKLDPDDAVAWHNLAYAAAAANRPGRAYDAARRAEQLGRAVTAPGVPALPPPPDIAGAA